MKKSQYNQMSLFENLGMHKSERDTKKKGKECEYELFVELMSGTKTIYLNARNEKNLFEKFNRLYFGKILIVYKLISATNRIKILDKR